MKKNSTSITISTKGRANLVCRCVDSILKQSLLPDEVEIIDADKGSAPNKVLKERFSPASPQIKYVHSKTS